MCTTRASNKKNKRLKKIKEKIIHVHNQICLPNLSCTKFDTRQKEKTKFCDGSGEN